MWNALTRTLSDFRPPIICGPSLKVLPDPRGWRPATAPADVRPLTRGSVRRFGRVGLLAALVPGALGAQVIEVRAVDQGTRDPAASAIISLLDSTGAILTRGLTDQLGRVVLRVPRSGEYRIQGDRIGYTGTVSDPIRLQVPGAPFVIRLVLGVTRVSLPDVVVRGNQVACGVEGVAGAGLAEAWEETRKTLTATTLTTDQVRPTIEIRTFARELDLKDRVTSERTLQVRQTTGPPFATVEPRKLWVEGFAEPAGDDIVYYAPDAKLLLTEEFLRYHCFRLVRGSGEYRGLLGLGFEPLPDRDVPDVKGTLWIDPQEGALRELSYDYVNLERDFGQAAASGMLSFAGVPGVGWIVERWHIRSPRFRTQHLRGVDGSGGRARTDIAGYFETGGEAKVLERVVGPAVIAGVVWDSLDGGPLVGARVALSGGTPSTLTDDEGRYRLEIMQDGDVAFATDHPRLTLFGIKAPESVRVARGSEVRVDVGIPSLAQAVALLCPSPPPGSDSTMAIAGVVQHADGQPAVDVDIFVRWERGELVRQGSNPLVQTRASRMETGSDEEGRFQICHIPYGAQVEVRIGDADASPTTFLANKPFIPFLVALPR